MAASLFKHDATLDIAAGELNLLMMIVEHSNFYQF